VSAVNPDMTIAGEPANFMGRRQQKALDHILGSMEAAGYVMGAGELAGAGYNAAKAALAESIESGVLSKLRSKPTSISFSADDVGRNLIDLQEAKKFAQQYGYELPANLERISQSNMLTDRTIRGMMDRHNTFVRGVSTNWDEIAKRNPEILRHLEGKGIDWKNNPKAAAEYMTTHIPINTGYGRASLNTEVFDRGLQGLYTSNSIPTAEGYTYGQGFITKVKKPTDFSSANRLDWITKNNPIYQKDRMPSSQYVIGNEDISKLLHKLDSEFNNYKKIKPIIGKPDLLNEYKDFVIKEWEDDLAFAISNPKIHGGDPVKIASDLEKLKSLDFTKLNIKNSGQDVPSLLRTERSELPTDAFNFLLKKEGNAKGLSEYLKKQPYQEKMKEVHNLGESLTKYSWNEQQPIRAKIKELENEATSMYNQSVQDYMKANHPDYDPINRYAHYIHLGTPGEKVLQPIKSWEITPEIWKNKSRAHTNTYSKKFSALEEGGVIKDDRGQWAHPGEITEIDSNEITMQGVPYPVLGISDEGDTKMMFPEQEYKFKGKKVTEYPLKKSTGGWLDKY